MTTAGPPQDRHAALRTGAGAAARTCLAAMAPRPQTIDGESGLAAADLETAFGVAIDDFGISRERRA